HPNDDVNKSQSSNDTYTTEMHIAAVLKLEDRLLPALETLKSTLRDKVMSFQDIVKIGRTHLQDATPITLGEEMSGWYRMLEIDEQMITDSRRHLNELAIGGTAVGTGLNAHPECSEHVCEHICTFTERIFTSAVNKFHSLPSYDEMVYSHGS